MKEYYYCLDGHTTDGPHSEGEIAELIAHGVLKPENLICAAGDKEWTSVKNATFITASPNPTSVASCTNPAAAAPTATPSTATPSSTSPTPTPISSASPHDTDILAVDHAAVASAGTDADTEEEKDDTLKEADDKGLSKYQLIKAIRTDLDLLWKAQRESLICHIRGIELDSDFETTRKQAKDIKSRVKEACLSYWKKANSYEGWIEELVWQDCDIQRKLRGDGCEAKFQDAVDWLTEAKLIDKAGCYCFKNGKEYLYIGKAGTGDSNLGRRLRDHRRSVYFEHATHLRVVIPRYKTWISKLERLLLLQHPDAQYNDATPTMGRNPVDDTLELLMSEMDDLLQDG